MCRSLLFVSLPPLVLYSKASMNSMLVPGLDSSLPEGFIITNQPSFSPSSCGKASGPMQALPRDPGRAYFGAHNVIEPLAALPTWCDWTTFDIRLDYLRCVLGWEEKKKSALAKMLARRQRSLSILVVALVLVMAVRIPSGLLSGMENIIRAPNGIQLNIAHSRESCTQNNDTSRRILFTGAGYDIGHECLDDDGVADWRRYFDPLDSEFHFCYTLSKHAILFLGATTLTHHPSAWERKAGESLKNYMDREIRDEWERFDGPVKTLAWWTQANRLALRNAHMWWRLEDFDAKKALFICEFAGLQGCRDVDWGYFIAQKKSYNSHKSRDQPNLNWTEGCKEKFGIVNDICRDAEMLCVTLGYENCR
ncbi:hypothetical protein Naga_100448g6 [Nannochloropsis gaditana]|uniref:Uncharacterized protein n=1 Tax=Nannochloropsis gaditana TaxID=72520 RepID=W7TA30_9STRA|nr:hypothetical protein Naga_100448g6 [Nannochloropsis gaditana]